MCDMADVERQRDSSEQQGAGEQQFTETPWTSSTGNQDYFAATSRTESTASSLPTLTFEDFDGSDNDGFLTAGELNAVANSNNTQTDRDIAKFLGDRVDEISDMVDDEWGFENDGISRTDLATYLDANANNPDPMFDRLRQMMYPSLQPAVQQPNSPVPDDLDADLPGEVEAPLEEEVAEGTPQEQEVLPVEDVPAEEGDAPSEAPEGDEAPDATEVRPEITMDKNESGQVTQVHIKVPGQDQEITLSRQDNGSWAINPPGAEVPGFKNLRKNEDGTVAGDFSTTPDGEPIYKTGDGISEILHNDGSREVRNMQDYSREIEKDGQKTTEYWDGYEWRQAESVTKDGDKTVVTFAPVDGKPTQIERNGATDELKVSFGTGLEYNANWREQRLDKTKDGETVRLYNSGVQDGDGNTVWRAGTVLGTDANGNYAVQFTDEPPASDGTQYAAGEQPTGAVIRLGSGYTSGEVTASYEQVAQQEEEQDQQDCPDGTCPRA